MPPGREHPARIAYRIGRTWPGPNSILQTLQVLSDRKKTVETTRTKISTTFVARTSWIFWSLSGAHRKHHFQGKLVAELATCVCIGSWLAAGYGSSRAGQTLAVPLFVTRLLFHLVPILFRPSTGTWIAKEVFWLLWSESPDSRLQ